jgi:dTDP-4-dehydrorhamnose reductase
MILVTGNGRLANELEKLSTDSLPITTLSRREMDITNEYMVSDVIKKFMVKPDFPKYLIHTAALTKPMEVNDRNPIMSMDTNIVGTANVARVCSKYGIKFIYISTDFVYGDSELVDENSQVKPLNNYGWSKLGGECITKLILNSLILRCSLCDIPFRHKVAFDDVCRNSISHQDVASIILKVKDEAGIVNVGGKYQSVYDFVSSHQKIKKASGSHLAPSLNLNIDKLMDIIDE